MFYIIYKNRVCFSGKAKDICNFLKEKAEKYKTIKDFMENDIYSSKSSK